MYVPDLKKNLVSVVVLEDKRYDLVFGRGKAYLKHVAIIQVKQIGVQVKNIYEIEVDACAALSSKEEHVHC